MSGFHVLAWAQVLGAGRLMFGSDHAENAATELTKFRTAGLNPAQLESALGSTAATVFRLKH